MIGTINMATIGAIQVIRDFTLKIEPVRDAVVLTFKFTSADYSWNYELLNVSLNSQYIKMLQVIYLLSGSNGFKKKKMFIIIKEQV